MIQDSGPCRHVEGHQNTEILRAVGEPEVRRKLEHLGFAVRGSSPEQFRAMTRDQLATYARIIKQNGIANQ